MENKRENVNTDEHAGAYKVMLLHAAECQEETYLFGTFDEVQVWVRVHYGTRVAETVSTARTPGGLSYRIPYMRDLRLDIVPVKLVWLHVS